MRNLVLLLVLLTLALAGCSGGTSPLTPNNAGSIDSAPIIGLTDADGTFNAIGMMGAYELIINDADVQLVPKRSSAIGEGYIVSGAEFWTVAPCSNCMKIKTYTLSTGGNLVVTFTMDHPFPKGNTGQPPTAANRLDLNVFDLAAVIAPQSGTATTYSGLGVSVFNKICANPDGYTKELSNVITDTAALPFFLVIDDSGLATGTYNKFEMGVTGKEFAVEFNLATGAVPAFDIYLTMGYGASAAKLQRLNPKYYNPEFNRKAPWKVNVNVAGDWMDNDAVTTNDVTVAVYDWQHAAVVSTTSPYSDETDTTKIFAASAVSSVKVEIPGLAPVDELLVAASGTGAQNNPLIYTFAIANENLLAAGEYVGLVKVADSRAAGAGTAGAVDSMVDAALAWYAIPEFATYQTFSATVLPSCGPITGYITNPPLANIIPIETANYATMNFAVVAESAGTGNITLYEMDMDYDGVTFDTDASNATGLFPGVQFEVPGICEDEVPYDITLAWRATDDCATPNTTIFKTATVRILYCPLQAIGNVTLTVNRDASNGYRVPLSATPITLSWTPVAGAAEQVIYYDTDPGDLSVGALTDNLVELATVSGTATSWTIGASQFPSNNYVPGWTFVVRNRLVIGDANTESQNSELVWVQVTGFETVASYTYDTFEGWTTFCEYPTKAQSYVCCVYNYSPTYQVGNGCWGYGYYMGSSFPNKWTGITRKTPVGVPNSNRYFDWTMYNQMPGGYGGVAMITCDGSGAQPGQNWTQANNARMEWVKASTTTPYQGYNYNQYSALNSWGFTGVENANNHFSSAYNYRSGGCIDNAYGSGEPTDPYVGFLLFMNYSSWYGSYPLLDQIVLAIH